MTYDMDLAASAAAEAERQRATASVNNEDERRDVLGFGEDLAPVVDWIRKKSKEPKNKNDPNLGRPEDGPLMSNYTPPQQDSDVAEDGQTLLLQTPWTQQAFRTNYGARAEIEWAKQHNEELKKNRATYGVSEPKPGQKVTTGTVVAPDRKIGAQPAPIPGVVTSSPTTQVPGYTPQTTALTYKDEDTIEVLDTVTGDRKTMTGAEYKEQIKLYPYAATTTRVQKILNVSSTPATQANVPAKPAGDVVWGTSKLVPGSQPSWWKREYIDQHPGEFDILPDPTQVEKQSLNTVNINSQPVHELALMSSKGAAPADVRAEEQRILNGIGSLLRGDSNARWVEPYLNDIARVAWARESRDSGRTVNPRDAPTDYIERWKDAFYGSDASVPLVRDLDQQMMDNAISRTSAGEVVFNWKQAFGENGERGLISKQVASNDCGPNAFSTILRSRGYNLDPASAFEYAKQTGYHNGEQFTGPYRMAEMLRKETGLDAQTTPMDWAAVDKELDAGRPVALSSGGHYWVVAAYRNGSGGREYYTGSTGAVVGNPEWARPEQIQYGGAPNYMVTAKGPVDPNARGVQSLGLRPPGPQSSRQLLSQQNPTSSVINPDINTYGTNVTGLIETGSTVGQYAPLIQRAGTLNNVDPLLVAAIADVESQGVANARSSQGAGGVMQLMGRTARSLGVTDVDNPEQNIQGGAQYIRQQLDQFNGDLDLSLAAYNAGPGAVMTYGGVPPYAETQDYVRRVKARYNELRSQTMGEATSRSR